MSKVLKIVGKIVTIAAFAAGVLATGGLLAAGAPLFTAISVGFTGVISGLGFSATALLAGGALLSAIGGAVAGAPRLEETGANQRGTPFVDAGAASAYVFGETAAPLALVFEENYGANKEFVANVLAHAWHRIDAFTTLHVDAELVSFSGNAATGAFAGIITWLRNVGTQGQAALPLPGTPWPSTAKGAGIAHSAIVWNFKNQTKLAGGVPTNIVVSMRGAFLYDPRLDSSVGGSGAQRYDDPATWTYNAGNAALVALRYIIGERAADGRLIWGVGEAQTDVDIASFIAAANVADEVRDSVARYALAGFYPTSNDHEGFFRQWEANTGGKVTRVGGRRYVWLPHNDLIPITTITDDDVLSGAVVTLRAATPIEELVNTARGRYISAADLYQGAIYPEVSEASAVSDDGAPRVLDLDFSWVQVRSQAERTARQAVRRSRFGRVWSLAVGWEGIVYPVFSVLALSLKETDYVTTLARVVDKTMSASGVAILTLQEEDAAIYDDTIPLGSPVVNNSVVNRLSRFGTTTPRYIDGTPIDGLRPADPGATKGAAGIGPPGIRIGDGATTIAIHANQTSGGSYNPGEIRLTEGFWRFHDGTVRTLTGEVIVETTYESTVTPPDGVFYVIWGVTPAAQRFPGIANFWSSGGPKGLFSAEFDRTAGIWRAVNGGNEKAAFTPLTTDVVFAVGVKTAADTQIALLIPQVAAIEGFVDPDALGSSVQKADTGGAATRVVPIGVSVGLAFDGDVFAFSQSWGSPPAVVFGAGGRATDPALNNTQQADYKAINLTASGFTASLKLREGIGAPNVITDTGTTIGGPGFIIEKTSASQPGSDSYRFNYTVDPGQPPPGEPSFGIYVRVGFYTRSTAGGAWVKRGEVQHNSGPIQSASQSLVVDGLGSDAAFAISLESTGAGNGGIVSFDSVVYDIGAGASATATPAGSAPVPFMIVGNHGGI